MKKEGEEKKKIILILIICFYPGLEQFIDFDYENWEQVGKKIENRELEVYAATLPEKIELNLTKLYRKIRQKSVNGCLNRTLGIFQRPLPQIIKNLDMRFVDTRSPGLRSFLRNCSPLNLLAGLLDSEIKQDEILNYFFRIDILFYDFQQKGIERLIENIEPIKKVWQLLEEYKDRQITRKGSGNKVLDETRAVKDPFEEVDFRADFKVYVLESQLRRLESRYRDGALMEQLEHLLDQINDLYRYSLSKERILDETRQNEWVQTVNREEDRYMSVDEARLKLEKIKQYQALNRVIRENRRTRAPDQIDRDENNTWGYFLCYFLLPCIGCSREKRNEFIEYHEQYGRWETSKLLNLEVAVSNLEMLLEQNPQFQIQDRRLTVQTLEGFQESEFFDIRQLSEDQVELVLSEELVEFFHQGDVKTWRTLKLDQKIMENMICLDLISRKILSRGLEVQTVHFESIQPLKIGSLKMILDLIRDLRNLRNFVVENCVLNQSNIGPIGDLIRWRKASWKRIAFINCGLTDLDLRAIFYQGGRFRGEQYPNLREIDLRSNPQIDPGNSEVLLDIHYELLIRGLEVGLLKRLKQENAGYREAVRQHMIQEGVVGYKSAPGSNYLMQCLYSVFLQCLGSSSIDRYFRRFSLKPIPLEHIQLSVDAEQRILDLEYPFREGTEKSLVVCLENINRFDSLQRLEVQGLSVRVSDHILAENLMGALLKSKNLLSMEFIACQFDLEFLHQWFTSSGLKNYQQISFTSCQINYDPERYFLSSFYNYTTLKERPASETVLRFLTTLTPRHLRFTQTDRPIRESFSFPQSLEEEQVIEQYSVKESCPNYVKRTLVRERDQFYDEKAILKKVDLLYLWIESLHSANTQLPKLKVLDFSGYNFGESQ